MHHHTGFRRFIALAVFLAFGVTFALAQETATVKVRVGPPEAYIFVDGQPFAHRSQTITLNAGEHTIGVYNYGYVPQVQTVTLQPGKNPEIVARLEKVPGNVTGPWGRIQIEGAANDKAAVFLNEMKPDFFVGYVDEMNNEKLATQKLVVPVGTYQLILVNPKETQPAFSQQIEVKNNQRVVVHVDSNTTSYHDWDKAGHKKELSRFSTGPNTARITVAPVTAPFTTDKNDIKCGEPVTLTWTSTEAAEVTIAASPVMQVPLNGQRTDTPTQTTTYTFQAKGPGGIVTHTATVHVDQTVQTAMKASPEEVHYRRIDDKVIDPGNHTLTWKTENAHSASIDPLGTVATNGDKTVPAQPKKTDVGPVDEMATYVLVAKNNCGGLDKTLAAVHITGIIEPLPLVPLTSIYFPTAYPTEKHPELGLLNSQNDLLKEAVAGFKKFLEYDPDAKLKLTAHTDHRSSDDFNMELAGRRGNIVKSALVALGVDEAKITMVPEGETPQLDEAAVKLLEDAAGMHRKLTDDLVHAYNRRVDIDLTPTTKPVQESKQAFPPRGSKETKILESNKFQGLRTVEKVSTPVGAPSAAGQQ